MCISIFMCHISPTTVANLPNKGCFALLSVSLTYAAYQFPVQLQGLICGITFGYTDIKLMSWYYHHLSYQLSVALLVDISFHQWLCGIHVPVVSVWRTTWKIGQSQGLQPRVLHDIDSVVIVVACQYRCTNGHTFLTTDPRVLELISTENIPFILLLIEVDLWSPSVGKSLVGEAMSTSAVEWYIKEQRRCDACFL